VRHHGFLEHVHIRNKIQNFGSFYIESRKRIYESHCFQKNFCFICWNHDYYGLMESWKHTMMFTGSNCENVSWGVRISWGIEDHHTCNYRIKFLDMFLVDEYGGITKWLKILNFKPRKKNWLVLEFRSWCVSYGTPKSWLLIFGMLWSTSMAVPFFMYVDVEHVIWSPQSCQISLIDGVVWIRHYMN